MSRTSAELLLAAAFVALVSACTTTTTTTGASVSNTTSSASSYSHRALPQRSLRGELVVTAAPEVRVNGKITRLSAGSKIRNEGNMIVMATALTNQRLVVNYTLDIAGQIQDVWILGANERTLAWPRTPEEAQRWEFDPNRQAWIPR